MEGWGSTLGHHTAAACARARAGGYGADGIENFGLVDGVGIAPRAALSLGRWLICHKPESQGRR